MLCDKHCRNFRGGRILIKLSVWGSGDISAQLGASIEMKDKSDPDRNPAYDKIGWVSPKHNLVRPWLGLFKKSLNRAVNKAIPVYFIYAADANRKYRLIKPSCSTPA